MRRVASLASASGEMQLMSLLMKSMTLAFARSMPSATARMAMSRSVISPRSLSSFFSSTTGMTPVSASFIFLATSGSIVTVVTRASFGFSVIRSRTFIANPPFGAET
ncbi:hypothetical protein D3C72_2042140 [compost metagenome]